MACATCIERAQVVIAQRLLPLQSPGRRAWRQFQAFERPSVGLHLPEVAAADETERTMIEVVAIELVDAHADRAGGNERVKVVFILVEETERSRHGLVREVAAD